MSIIVRNPRNAHQAVATAESLIRSKSGGWNDLCDHAQGVYYGWGHTGEATARDHWDDIPSELKYDDPVPLMGGLGFWVNPSGGQGHVALAVGNNTWISTDIGDPGHITGGHSTQEITDWLGIPYSGYAAPYFPFGVVPVAPADKVWSHVPPVVYVSRVQPGSTDALRVLPVQEALITVHLLRSHLSGVFDAETVRAYSLWQNECGYTGQAADGAPGIASLSKLGQRTGEFTAAL